MATAKKTAPAPAPEVDDEELEAAAAAAEFEAAEGETIVGSNFPPYTKPYVGALYRFMPMYRDESDPDFIRNVCIWTGDKPLAASTGPVDAPEEVLVNKGEFFSFSDYKGIPFEELQGISTVSICREERKLAAKGNKPARRMFVFESKVAAEDNAKYMERKKERALALNAASTSARLVDTNDKVNSLPVTPSTGTPAQQQLRS